MAKGKKTGGRDWPKGKSAHPEGRPKLPEHVKEARKLNTIQITLIIKKYLNMTLTEIGAAEKDPETPLMDLAFIKILREAHTSGDHSRLNFLLDRTIGKVSDKLKVKMPKPTIINLIGDEAKALIVGAQENNEDEGDE